MKKFFWILLATAPLLLAACSAKDGNRMEHPLIRVDSPTNNQIIQSPFMVQGEASGRWFFEASFPVELQDANGKVLNEGPATTPEEWMTEDFIPFSYDLIFDQPETDTGLLILRKDNPSGLPEHEDRIEIPVQFK